MPLRDHLVPDFFSEATVFLAVVGAPRRLSVQSARTVVPGGVYMSNGVSL